MGFDDLLLKHNALVPPTQPATSGTSFEGLLKQHQQLTAPKPAAPAQAPPKPEAGVSHFGGLKVLATELLDTPESIAASLVTQFQGQSGASDVDPDIFERFVDRNREEVEARRLKVEQQYGEDYFLPGIQVKDVSGLAQNLGFSLANMAVGFGAGAATTAATSLTGPAALAAGGAATLAASGTAAYRASAFDITKQFLEAKSEELRAERGTGLTQAEEDAFKEEFSSTATEFGLWEALPEAAGNVLGFGIIGKPLGKIASKMLGKKAAGDVLTKFGAKFAGVKGLAAATAGELTTEAVTEVGQAQTLKDTILGEADPLDWNISDFGTALKRVAPQTLLLMGVLKGGGAAANKAIDAAANKAIDAAEYRQNKPQFTKLQEAHPEQKFKKVGGGLYETEVTIGETTTTMKGTPTLLASVLKISSGTATKQDEARVQNETEALQSEQTVIQEQLGREDLDAETRANLEVAQEQNQAAVESLGGETVVLEPQEAVVPPPVAEGETGQVPVGKIQITNQDRVDLAGLGFNGADIRVLKPAEAGAILEAAQKMPANTKVVQNKSGQFQLLDVETGSFVGEGYESKNEAIIQNAVQQDTSASTERFIVEQLNQGQSAEAVAEAVGMDAQTVTDIFNDSVHGQRLDQRTTPDVAPAPETPAPAQINPVKDILERKLNQYLALSGQSVELTEAPIPKGLEKTVAALEKMFGKKVHFYTRKGNLDVNGAFFRDEAEHIFIDVETNDAVSEIIGHELVHAIRVDNPEIYKELLDLITKYYSIFGGDAGRAVDRYVEALRVAKTAEGQPIDEKALRDEATEEFVADELGRRILDGWFLKEIAVENPTLFQQIMQIVDNFLLATREAIGPQGKSAIDNLQAELDNTLKKYRAADPNAEFGVGERFSRAIDPLGFYSPLQDSVGTLFDQKVLTGQQLLGKLEKAKKRDQKNFKQEEIDYVGLEDYFRLNAELPLTQEQVETFIADEGVKVEEVVRSDAPVYWVIDAEGTPLEAAREISTREAAEAARDRLEVENNETLYVEEQTDGYTTTGFGEYTLPGGTDYREVLLTIPPELKTKDQIAQSIFGLSYDELFPGQKADVDSKGDVEVEGGGFQSSHFDTPNILAHARINFRELANGERVLFIEEIQSDWAAEIRKATMSIKEKGRLTELEDKHFESRGELSAAENRELQTLLAKQNTAQEAEAKGLTPAPFVTSSAWQNLIMKRIIRIGAESNAQRIAWINGEQTAERYSLDKALSKISYNKIDATSYEIEAYDPSGNAVIEESDIPITRVEELVGKEIAKRVESGDGVKEDAEPGAWTKLSGDDLKIEAQWARNLYDKAVPNFMNKFGKKYGVKVEPVTLELSESEEFTDRQLGRWATAEEARKHQSEEAQPTVLKVTDDLEFPYEVWEAPTFSEQLSLPLNEGINQDVVLHGVPLFSRPLDVAKKITEKVKQKNSERMETLREMVKNPTNAKLRAFPNLLKTVPLPFKVDWFSKRMPKLKDLYDHVLKYTASKNGIVAKAQLLYDAAHQDKKNPEKVAAVNKVMATATIFRIVAGVPLMKQDWVPKNLRGSAALEAAEAAWVAEGMPEVTGGLTFRQANDFAQREFNALPPDMKKAYLDVRDDLKSIRSREYSSAVAAIQGAENVSDEVKEDLIRQLDQVFGIIRGDYFPLGRFGKYIIRVKDEFGNVRFEAHHETPERMFLQKKALEQSLPEGHYVEADTQGDLQFGEGQEISQEFVQKINELAEGKFVAGLDPTSKEGEAAAEQMQKFKDEMFQMWLRNAPEGSGLKNSVRRKGTPGFDADMLRSYIDYMISHASSVAYAEEGQNIERLLLDMGRDAQRKIEDGDKDGLIDKVVLEDMRHHLETARVSKTSKLSQFLGKVSLVWYLSSPSQFVVQMSQLGIVTMPRLAARHGISKATKAMTTALQKALTYKRYTPAMISTMDGLWDRIDARVSPKMVAQAQEQDRMNKALIASGIQPTAEDVKLAELKDTNVGEPLLTEAEQNQLIEDTLGSDQYKRDLLVLRMAIAHNIHDNTLTHEALEVRKGQDRGGLAKKFAFFIRESELASRKAATWAAFDLAQQQGKPFMESFEDAKMINITTLFDYSKEARPYALRANDWLRMITTFQVFRISMLFHMATLAHQSFKGLSAQERTIAKKELAGLLAVVSVAGGVTALPFLSAFMYFLELAAGDDDEPLLTWLELRNVLRNSIGDSGADAVMYGAPTMLGIDISSRIGLDSIFEPASGVPEYLSLGQTPDWMLANAAGPAYGVFADGAKGIEQIQKGNYLKGVSKMMPKLFRDPLKALDAAANGVRTSQGKAIMEEGALNPVELILMANGMNPNDFARANEANRNLTTLKGRIGERHGHLVRQFARAYEDENVEGREAAVEEIKAFNKAQPQAGITSSDLASVIRQHIKKSKAILSLNELILDRKYDIGVYKHEGQR